jgi:hypothetical protein
MFWKSDANGDGKMQVSEMALLELSADGVIQLYSVPPTARP